MQNKEYVVKQIKTLKKDIKSNRFEQYFEVILTGVCALITKASYETLTLISINNELSLKMLIEYLAASGFLLLTLGSGFLTIDGILSTLETTFERALLKNEKRKLEKILEQIQENEQTSNLTR